MVAPATVSEAPTTSAHATRTGRDLTAPSAPAPLPLLGLTPPMAPTRLTTTQSAATKASATARLPNASASTATKARAAAVPPVPRAAPATAPASTSKNSPATSTTAALAPGTSSRTSPARTTASSPPSLVPPSVVHTFQALQPVTPATNYFSSLIAMAIFALVPPSMPPPTLAWP